MKSCSPILTLFTIEFVFFFSTYIWTFELIMFGIVDTTRRYVVCKFYLFFAICTNEFCKLIIWSHLMEQSYTSLPHYFPIPVRYDVNGKPYTQTWSVLTKHNTPPHGCGLSPRMNFCFYFLPLIVFVSFSISFFLNFIF
jgi:hypothetical protein